MTKYDLGTISRHTVIKRYGGLQLSCFLPWQSSEELAETKMPIVLNSSNVENVTKSHIMASDVHTFVYLWWLYTVTVELRGNVALLHLLQNGSFSHIITYLKRSF